VLLMYHNLGSQGGFNTVAADRFREQLMFIRDNNFKSFSFRDYVRLVLEGQLPRNAVTLTFDDAYRSYLEIGLPLMEEFEIHSALFVPSGHVGGFNSWDSHQSDQRFEVMDWESLRSISKHPLVAIGSHSVTHPRLSTLPDNQQYAELLQSRRVLEEQLDIEVPYFAYPFGQLRDFTPATIRALQETGYVAACSTLWGLHNKPQDRFKLNRIDIDRADSMAEFRRKTTRKHHRKYFYRLIKDVVYGWK
jgi:peptidoglycan/xylan/chitin deacetylase (PgdA/CDA1 family)